MATSPFLARITLFAGNYAPQGWALCNGQLMSIQQNAALFSILGTTFGGDGIRTFGLPNFQGVAPMSWGSAPSGSVYVNGQTGGSENMALSLNQMPAHTHFAFGVNTTGGSADPTNNLPATPADASQANTTIYTPSTSQNVLMAQQMIGNSGGNQPHTNMQPYLCLSFIIALVGIYPSRN